jgi:hypothetical protein
VLDTVQQAPGQLTCPAWNVGSDMVLGLTDTSDADERRLHLIDLTGARPPASLDLPFAAVGRADFAGEDRLVVSDAAPSHDDDRGVWTVGVDGSDPASCTPPRGARHRWAPWTPPGPGWRSPGTASTPWTAACGSWTWRPARPTTS